MSSFKNYKNPLKIICLTEESVETLYHIGKGDLICGVSSFVKRPEEALKHPKVSLFTSSKIETIVNMQPDLILGFSDIQKDIAKELIEKGMDVWIANHRSIDGIFKYVMTLSRLVDAKEQGEKLIDRMLRQILKAQDFASSLKKRPRIYFEEWDEPMISAIEWVSEIIELCGGVSITHDFAKQKLAQERIISAQLVIDQNPDIIFGCWCGKKVKCEAIKCRPGWQKINAIKQDQVFELPPEIFLQPGPAVILDGIDLMIDYIQKWSDGV